MEFKLFCNEGVYFYNTNHLYNKNKNIDNMIYYKAIYKNGMDNFDCGEKSLITNNLVRVKTTKSFIYIFGFIKNNKWHHKVLDCDFDIVDEDRL